MKNMALLEGITNTNFLWFWCNSYLMFWSRCFMSYICILYSFVVYLYVSGRSQLPRLGKRELICLLLFTCNFVVSVRRGFLFLWVLGMG